MLLIFASDWVAREDFHPDETDTLADFNRNKFLDLSKPLLVQVWNAPWTSPKCTTRVTSKRARGCSGGTSSR
jgi:4-hydroxysphinganine ceramide fatty acyl 2-hydroxylase